MKGGDGVAKKSDRGREKRGGMEEGKILRENQTPHRETDVGLDSGTGITP